MVMMFIFEDFFHQEIVYQVTSLSIEHIFDEYIQGREHGYKAITNHKISKVWFTREAFCAFYSPIDDWNIHNTINYANRGFSQIDSPTKVGSSELGLVVPEIEEKLNEVVEYQHEDVVFTAALHLKKVLFSVIVVQIIHTDCVEDEDVRSIYFVLALNCFYYESHHY